MAYRFMRFPGGKPKAVTFSFDDGFWFDVPVSDKLSSVKMKGTFNITGNYRGEQRNGQPDLSVVKGKAYNELPITKSEIQKYLLDRGHEVAVHGFYHKAPGNTRAIDGIRDVLDCRAKLEHDFGGIIRGMAYPDNGITRFSNGLSYEKIREYLVDLDIAYARSLDGDNEKFEVPTDWLNWIPSAYICNSNLFRYIDKFLAIDVDHSYTALRHPRLLYLWGHSFEFHTRLGWDTLDRICDELSGKDDIWYATNIEIHDYVKAFDALRFSVDGRTVCNPTLIDVWFDIDGTVYCVKSGETKIIS